MNNRDACVAFMEAKGQMNDSKELVERLRIGAACDGETVYSSTFREAADLIERQAMVIEELHNLGTNHFPYDGPNGPCEEALNRARALTNKENTND